MADPTAPVLPGGVQLYAPPPVVTHNNWTGPSTTGAEMDAATRAELIRKKEADRLAAEKQAEIDRLAEAEALAKAADIDRQNKLRDEFEAKRIAADQERMVLVNTKMAERDQAKESMKAADKEAGRTFWEDRGAPRRVLTAFLIGMNTAAGGDQAYKVLLDAQADDRQRKMAKYERSKEFLAIAGQGVEAAEAARAKARDLIDIQQKAAAEKLKDELAAAALRRGTPQAKANAEKFAAETESKHAADDLAVRAQYKTTVNSGHASGGTTVNSGADGAGKPPTLPERKGEQTALAKAASMAKLAKLVTDNPKAWQEWQTAAREQREQEELAGPQGLKQVTALARGFGAAPLAIEQRLKSPAARAIHTALLPYVTANVRKIDPEGAINEYSMKQGADASGLLSSPANEIASAAKDFETEFRAEAAAVSPPRAQPADRPKPTKGQRIREVAEAQQKANSYPRGSTERERWEAVVAGLKQEAD